MTENSRILNQQIGGTHYKDFVIEPIDYIELNKLGFCEGNIIKYISRWRKKNGIEDLKKARHYIDYLIEKELKFIAQNNNPKHFSAIVSKDSYDPLST